MKTEAVAMASSDEIDVIEGAIKESEVFVAFRRMLQTGSKKPRAQPPAPKPQITLCERIKLQRQILRENDPEKYEQLQEKLKENNKHKLSVPIPKRRLDDGALERSQSAQPNLDSSTSIELKELAYGGQYQERSHSTH